MSVYLARIVPRHCVYEYARAHDASMIEYVFWMDKEGGGAYEKGLPHREIPSSAKLSVSSQFQGMNLASQSKRLFDEAMYSGFVIRPRATYIIVRVKEEECGDEEVIDEGAI